MRFIFVILVMVMVLSGCNVEQPVSKVGGNEQQDEKKKVPNQVFKVGDVVKIGDTELVVKIAKLRNGNPYVPPKKGKVIEIEIEGKNQGNQSWFLTNGDFNLYDKAGEKLEEYFAIDDQQLSGEVNQGKSIKGKIFYDVPEADSYELVYKPNFLMDQEIKFNIEPSK